MGSMFIFMSIFFFQIGVTMLLYFIRCGCMDWVYKKIKVGTIRMISFSFLFGAYIDLLIAALINTENFYLFDMKSNWGPDGSL